MNYNYLRYFSVLAQVEHYTLAAARLGISQPSLSSAIHQLEDELGGVKLFEKAGRNIRLTEEGRYYQEKVDSALRELNTASMTLRDSKVSAPVFIRMGLVSGTLEGTVARTIAEYIGQNERIRFRLTESSAEELLELARANGVEMNADEAATYFAQLNANDAVSDEELNLVAGGSCPSEEDGENAQKTNSHPCPKCGEPTSPTFDKRYRCNKCGYKT